MRSKGRILEFRKLNIQKMATKIKGGRGYQRTPFGYYNGFSSACGYPETYYVIEVVIYEPVKTKISIYIMDEIYEASGRQRITQQYLNYLKEANAGKKIWFYNDESKWDIEDYDDITF